MNKVDVLDQLFDARDALTDVIIHTSPAPGDQAGADTLEQLLQSRDRLTHAIAQVIATEIKASGDQVAQAVAKLGDLNKQLQNLAASIDAAKTGIAITAQVLNVLAQVVGAVL